MTTKAFILIETVAGRNKETVNELKQLEGIKSADNVAGPYDIIVLVERETLDDIGDLVINKINSIPAVSRTVTCLVI